MNIADQAYSSDYRSAYTYDLASVQVTCSAAGYNLSGQLVAQNLKPNFAYQLKLVGTPETPCNEWIGLAGRWWEEEWYKGSSWSGWSGHNLNDDAVKNDTRYYQLRDQLDPTSPTGKHYRYTAYMVLGFFVTDDLGNATYNFLANNSYHVLFKYPGSQAWDPEDIVATFDPSPSLPAYDTDYPSSTTTVTGQWERETLSGSFLGPGTYDCQMILTEESFHSTRLYGGNWAAAMGGPIHFSIPASLAGDVNLDCRVNALDLIKVRNWLGHTVGYDPADVNRDRKINILDLIWVRNRLGSKCSQ